MTKKLTSEKFSTALTRSLEWGDKIPTGIFYQNKAIPPFTKRLANNVPNYLEVTPAEQRVSTADGYTVVDPRATFEDKILY
ncbi:2-oxoglutarate ferredoxin oxidoreductase subunit beta [mine drainage metagenome]|uniref:2-oxoglutarate ferredoxin oxidoreductase subunit beta n=1 Tax=mine drainage metagenome TaxID=410659 RepID=T1A920_9ZZZZ